MDFLGKIHHFCNVLVKEHSYIHTQFNSKSFSGAFWLRFFYHVVTNMICLTPDMLCISPQWGISALPGPVVML